MFIRTCIFSLVGLIHEVPEILQETHRLRINLMKLLYDFGVIIYDRSK